MTTKFKIFGDASETRINAGNENTDSVAPVIFTGYRGEPQLAKITGLGEFVIGVEEPNGPLHIAHTPSTLEIDQPTWNTYISGTDNYQTFISRLEGTLTKITLKFQNDYSGMIELIDNFKLVDQVPNNGGALGPPWWYSYSDAESTDSINSVYEASIGRYVNEFTYSLGLTGTVWAGAAIWVGDAGLSKNTNYNGVRITYTSTVGCRITLPTSVVTDSSWHGIDLPPTGSGVYETANIYFSELDQPGWGIQVPFDPEKIISIEVRPPSSHWYGDSGTIRFYEYGLNLYDSDSNPVLDSYIMNATALTDTDAILDCHLYKDAEYTIKINGTSDVLASNSDPYDDGDSNIAGSDIFFKVYMKDDSTTTTDLLVIDDDVAEFDGMIDHNGVTVQRIQQVLTNGSEITIDASTSGWGTIQIGENLAFAKFIWDTNNSVTLITSNELVDTADTVGTFNIYNNTTNVALKNNFYTVDVTIQAELCYAPVVSAGPAAPAAPTAPTSPTAPTTTGGK